jgi:hypothetical protein
MPETRTITWIDSSLQNGQVDKTGFPEPTRITTIGFLVEENDDYLVLARDDMGDGDYRGLIAIPAVAYLETLTPDTEDE